MSHLFYGFGSIFSVVFAEPRVCGRAVLPAELPGGRAAELSISKSIPFQPRWHDRHMLHPSKQEAPHPFTKRQRPSTHTAFDAHTPTRVAGAQRHSHPAPQLQVRSGCDVARRQQPSLLTASYTWSVFLWPHFGSSHHFFVFVSIVSLCAFFRGYK